MPEMPEMPEMPVIEPQKRNPRHRRAPATVIALAVVVSLQVTCGGSDPSPTKRATDRNEEPDAVGAVERPLRLVSLSTLATRFVVEIGAADRLVGVDVESSRFVDSDEVAIVSLESAIELEPETLLVDDMADIDGETMMRFHEAGTRVIEFAPHDLEDAAAYTRELGGAWVGRAAAALFERRFSRPLALIAGAAPDEDRIRVLAVIDLEPLTLAGGHSFETDLIEIGGGRSMTHGGEEPSIIITDDPWARYAPDLVIVAMPGAAQPEIRNAVRSMIPADLEVEFFDFDRRTFWLEQPETEARRMRDLIARVASGR